MPAFHQKISVRLTLSLMPIVGLALLVIGCLGAWRESDLIERDMERDATAIAGAVAYVIGDSRATVDVAMAWARHLDETTPDRHITFLPGSVDGDGREEAASAVVVRAPVVREGQRIGWVRVEESFSRRDAFVLRALAAEGLGIGVAFFLATLVARAVGTKLIAARVEKIRNYLREVGSGTFPSSPLTLGDDELGEIGVAAHAMAGALSEARDAAARAEGERARASLLTRRADRLAAVGKMSAAFAHEVGTPLAVILGHSRKLASAGDKDTQRATTIVIEQAERISAFVQRMLTYARHDDRFELVPVHLGRAVETAVVLVEWRARANDIRLQARGSEVMVLGDPRALEQVCVNLLSNAIDASPRGGCVEITADAPTSDAFARIDVTDAGPGILREARERVFDPFFTTKPADQGTGLGLYIVREIVQDLGGTVRILDSLEGCHVRVELPVVR